MTPPVELLKYFPRPITSPHSITIQNYCPFQARQQNTNGNPFVLQEEKSLSIVLEFRSMRAIERGIALRFTPDKCLRFLGKAG